MSPPQTPFGKADVNPAGGVFRWVAILGIGRAWQALRALRQGAGPGAPMVSSKPHAPSEKGAFSK